ncbi:unnamed protein product [Ambrosiozyma monospora]|uniref:Unnamed protein product n=1 Tax=Ambrosiozyma monospora TaxID=43982 RepID=A0A9W6T4J6_AMBMO|nr:unnamed protein product [Ambrosiozyma monospora]
MFCVVISSFGVCLAQVGVLALVNVEGAIYANANVVGNAVAGVLPSISMIAAVLLNSVEKGDGDSGKVDQLAADKSRVREAVVYFLVSALVAGSVLVFIFLLRKYEEKQQQESYQKLNPAVSTIVAGVDSGNDELPSNIFADDGHDHHDDDIESSETEGEHVNIPFSHLWFYLKYVFSSIFLTFALTLIFPVYASSVESTGTTIEKKVFIPLAFFVWNTGDLAGRIICAFPKR